MDQPMDCPLKKKKKEGKEKKRYAVAKRDERRTFVHLRRKKNFYFNFLYYICNWRGPDPRARVRSRCTFFFFFLYGGLVLRVWCEAKALVCKNIAELAGRGIGI